MTTVNHYINALCILTNSTCPNARTFARKILRDLCEKGVNVHDYLKPYMTLPIEKLDREEKALRRLAEQGLG